MKDLFKPTRLGGMKLKNRFIRSATYDGLADDRGHMTADLFKVYEDLAKGGVGTIITGLTYVTDLEQPYPGQMGIYDDSFIDEYKSLTAMSHRYDAAIIVQLAGLGSQTAPGTGSKAMWGPSAVKDRGFNTIPQEMSNSDIQLVQSAFGEAALRAKNAGFDGVQMHVAHGYLLSKFLTPYYNRRSDRYGGSIENRARMVLETYQAIRAKVGPEYPVFVKINSEDFMTEGMTFGQCKYVCRKLAQAGINAIEISGGSRSSRPNEGFSRPVIPGQEPYFKAYAAEVAREIDVPVIAVGGNHDLTVSAKILQETAVEYLALCRPLICESDLIRRWQSGDRTPAKCVACNKCFGRSGTKCVFNR